MDWRRDWISSLYLSFQSGSVELQEEFLVYDFQVSAASNYSFTKKTVSDCFCLLPIRRICSVTWEAILDFFWAGKSF